MKDIKKLLEMIEREPEMDNERLLNDAGLSPDMSIEEVHLMNNCINIIKKEKKDVLEELKKLCS